VKLIFVALTQVFFSKDFIAFKKAFRQHLGQIFKDACLSLKKEITKIIL